MVLKKLIMFILAILLVICTMTLANSLDVDYNNNLHTTNVTIYEWTFSYQNNGIVEYIYDNSTVDVITQPNGTIEIHGDARYWGKTQ